MFFPGHKSLIDRIHDKEMDEFQKTYVQNNTTQIIDNPFIDGNVLYKIPVRRSSIQELLKHNRFPVEDGHTPTYHNDQPLFDAVTKRILDVKLGKSFKECMAFIAKLRAKAGNNLYGVILRSATNKNVIINPLHPLSAIAMLDNPEYKDNMVFNVLAYFYPSREYFDRSFNTDKADRNKIKANIDALLISYTNKLNTEIKIERIVPDKYRNGHYDIEYRTKKHPDEESTNDYYISTHQLITKGILAPYYGASLIKMGDNETSGAPLTPCSSANISGNGYRDFTKLVFTSVCTGSMNNRTLEGLRSLTHSNLSSPYNLANFLDGSLAYIDACINKAFELYIKTGIVKDQEGLILADYEEQQPYSEEELACASFKEFKALNKNITVANAFILWKEIKRYKHDKKENKITQTSVREEQDNEFTANADSAIATTTN